MYCRQSQLSSIEAAKAGAEAKAAEALETVLAAVPRHRQDLVLIEALDRALDRAQKTATKKFVDSTAASGTIATQIAALQQLLQPQVSKPPLIMSQQTIPSLFVALVEWCTSQLSVALAMEETRLQCGWPSIRSISVKVGRGEGVGEGGGFSVIMGACAPRNGSSKEPTQCGCPFPGKLSFERTLCLHMLCLSTQSHSQGCCIQKRGLLLYVSSGHMFR